MAFVSPSTALGTHWELGGPTGVYGGVAAPKTPGVGTWRVPSPVWGRGGRVGSGIEWAAKTGVGRGGGRSAGPGGQLCPGGQRGPVKPPHSREGTTHVRSPPRPLLSDHAHSCPYLSRVGVAKAMPRWHWRGVAWGRARGRGLGGAGSRQKAAASWGGGGGGAGTRYRVWGHRNGDTGTPGPCQTLPSAPHNSAASRDTGGPPMGDSGALFPGVLGSGGSGGIFWGDGEGARGSPGVSPPAGGTRGGH